MSSITYDGNGLVIDGEHKILYGGEFHYFRTHSSKWEDRLRKMARGGCNLVTTYIPWNWHEKEEGRLKWDGEQDLGRFLELCKKHNLYVIVKPGPYICAEWDFGGYPHWIYGKNLRLRVGEEKYLNLTRTWFNHVADVIRPHLVTNGGSIVMVQVENEYDHLIKIMPEVYGGVKEAREYILKLLGFIRDAGIDVPVYSNDGSCIFGTEIINTNTYYPNIPGLVMWVFDFFDEQMIETRENQPDKPLAIMEAQGGWFSRYGTPCYYLPLNAFEAVVKSIGIHAPSILNFYMYTGGSNFPYWGSAGDGIGLTTSYDFVGAPVSEWGELRERYAYARIWSYWLNSFPGFTLNGRPGGEATFLGGSEGVACLYADGARENKDFQDTYMYLRKALRRSEDFSAILLRNLEDEDLSTNVRFESEVLGREITVVSDGKLTLENKSALFLPIDVRISGDLQIAYSTSELVLRKQLGDTNYLVFRGSKGVPGEMRLVAAARPEILAGEVAVRETDSGAILNYAHSGRTIFRVGSVMIVILENAESLKLWMEDNLLMLTDFYHLCGVRDDGGRTTLDLLVKGGGRQRTLLWRERGVKKISLDGANVPFRTDPATSAVTFTTDIGDVTGNRAEFTGNWKYMTDTDEIREDYDDSSWDTIPADVALERAGYYEHGFYWYRADFDVPEGATDLRIDFKTNGLDRHLIYVNGEFISVRTGDYWHKIDHVARPGRNTLAVQYANEFHTKAHPNEGPIQKESGLFNPVTLKGTLDGKEFERPFKQYKIRYGLGGDLKGYFDPDLDDSQWMDAPPSPKYIIRQEAGPFTWLRRHFSYTRRGEGEAPLMLRFHDLKERCLVFINGVAVARHESCGPQFEYYIPDHILKADNVLAMYIEGPGYHYRRSMGYRPAYFEDPEFDFFFQARKMTLTIE